MERTSALAGLLLAAALCAAPQDAGKPASRPEIHGAVLEAGTSQPVVDADVSLYFRGEERPSIRVALGVLGAQSTTRTDFTGAFAFHPDKLGFYAVAVRKEGYSAPGQGGGNSSKDVTLTAADPVGEARLFLARPGRVAGSVVDETTDKPLPNLSLLVAEVRNVDGFHAASGGAGGVATTGPDGRFVVTNLRAGEYVVVTQPQRNGKERLLTKFSDTDLKAVDQDYERAYWPGGHDLETAIPVVVGSGASVDIGTVRARAVPHYRLRVRVPAATCSPQDTMAVYEQYPGYLTGIAEDVPCGAEMLITGFAPGSYRLILTVNRRTAEARETASIPFVIKDENIEITAPLERGLAVDGTLAAADGARAPDFTKIRIGFYPIGAIPFADLAMGKAADAAGKFRRVGVPPVKHKILISGLGAGNYVKETRYNGIPVDDLVLPLDRSAMTQSLTILIDDKPAAVTGVVTSGDKPVGEPYVILAKWPLPGGDSPYSPARVAGDDKGKFQFTGLTPGEYRIVALRSREEDDNRAPGALERALEGAKKIELGPSAFQNVTVEVGSLR